MRYNKSINNRAMITNPRIMQTLIPALASKLKLDVPGLATTDDGPVVMRIEGALAGVGDDVDDDESCVVCEDVEVDNTENLIDLSGGGATGLCLSGCLSLGPL